MPSGEGKEGVACAGGTETRLIARQGRWRVQHSKRSTRAWAQTAGLCYKPALGQSLPSMFSKFKFTTWAFLISLRVPSSLDKCKHIFPLRNHSHNWIRSRDLWSALFSPRTRKVWTRCSLKSFRVFWGGFGDVNVWRGLLYIHWYLSDTTLWLRPGTYSLSHFTDEKIKCLKKVLHLAPSFHSYETAELRGKHRFPLHPHFPHYVRLL